MRGRGRPLAEGRGPSLGRAWEGGRGLVDRAERAWCMLRGLGRVWGGRQAPGDQPVVQFGW